MHEKMNLEEKYRRAVTALQEIAQGRGPYKVDQLEFAESVIVYMRDVAQKTLTELNEEMLVKWKEGHNQ